MKIYELILIQDGVEHSLGALYKDEKKAFTEKATQNNRRSVKGHIADNPKERLWKRHQTFISSSSAITLPE